MANRQAFELASIKVASVLYLMQQFLQVIFFLIIYIVHHEILCQKVVKVAI